MLKKDEADLFYSKSQGKPEPPNLNTGLVCDGGGPISHYICLCEGENGRNVSNTPQHHVASSGTKWGDVDKRARSARNQTQVW